MSSESNTSSEKPTDLQPIRKSYVWWLRRLVPSVGFLLVGLLLIFLLGLAQRLGWIRYTGTGEMAATAEDAAHEYTCPMHPQIRQPIPGRCPICGMALVPASQAGASADEFAVTITPAQRRLANIETAEVTKRPVTSVVRTIGAIQIDESRQATIASYINGRVERMFADYTGVDVRAGDHLAVVYSPELYSAQVEFIEASRALQEMATGALASIRVAQQSLVANTRLKLGELGMTSSQIEELETSRQPQSRMTIHAPIGGTVIEKLAEEGKYIAAGEPIYRIANLSTVWLMLELYPEDATRIRFGQQVEATLTSMPEYKLLGRVAFIDPTVNIQSRTVGVRVELDNSSGRLRPGDYAQATIRIPIGSQGEVYDEQLAGKWISPMHPQVIRDEPGDCPICGMELVPTSRFGYSNTPVAQPKSIVIPRSSVLMAGEYSVAYVETEPGRFELRTLALGPIVAGQAVVLDGLKPGERVATSGNFLIDSQMQLEGKPSLIDPTRYLDHQAMVQANTPLSTNEIEFSQVDGPAAESLEQLLEAYFDVQHSLAADELPDAETVETLARIADSLSDDDQLEANSREQLQIIVSHAEQLAGDQIDRVRRGFRSISQAVIRLAAHHRSRKAEQLSYHFFCPMVKGGHGDWLQDNPTLANPYYGSEMLRCGELVSELPPHQADNAAEQQPSGGSNALRGEEP
ncbi:MAG: efflux RND transporter periplasmic adaptor subunit [Pirellulaceae bacterium]